MLNAALLLGAVWYAGAPCPPEAHDFGYTYTIGRTMFETDRLPAAFVPRWVPCLAPGRQLPRHEPG